VIASGGQTQLRSQWSGVTALSYKAIGGKDVNTEAEESTVLAVDI
jgi:hypothetical protein